MARPQVVTFLLNGLRDTSGEPLSGGKVYTYAAGTSTEQSVYTDSAGVTMAPNPVVLDANGQAQVYANGNYKFIVKDSDDTTLYTWDNLLFGLDDDTSIWAGTSTGSSNAYAIAPSPAITALAAGQRFTFLANHTSSGAATLNVSGLGATTLKNTDGSAIGASDIASGGLYEAAYNGTDFQLVGQAIATPVAVASGGTGASTAGDARTNLGLAIGSNVQAWDQQLTDFAALAVTNNLVPVMNGTTITAEAINTFIQRLSPSTWTPTASANNGASISSLTVNEGRYIRIGTWIVFVLSCTFTITGSPTLVYFTGPVSGTGHDTNVALSCSADENGTAITNARWRYISGNNIMVFKAGLSAWTAGVNAAINIFGFYRVS